MSAVEVILLLVAGIGAGIAGSTAGLASLISYPALLLIGLSPVVANVTNTVSLIGSSIGSVGGSRRELAGLARSLWRRLPIAIIGGALGAVLILISPPGSFAVVVPYLVALASVLLLLSPRIRTITTVRKGRQLARPEGGLWVTAALFPCFVYGGYFGAAAGVMILALLLAGSSWLLPVANAVKNLLLGAANGVAAVIFASTADVYWPAVPPMLIGCVIGGSLGPAVVRRIPPVALRWFIGLAGLGLAVRLWID